jgi:hypothetical protein
MDLNRPFSKVDIQMASRYVKKVLDITNHQKNTNLNCNKVSAHPIRMAAIKKTNSSKHWWACEEKEMLIHCW